MYISTCIKCTCTDIGAEFGDVRPLDEARKRALTVNRNHLLKYISSDALFLTELVEVGAITLHQLHHLSELVHSHDRNDKLLEFITRRSVADYQNFIKALSKGQEHLVPLLITDGGEIFLVVLIKMQQFFFIIILLVPHKISLSRNGLRSS